MSTALQKILHVLARPLRGGGSDGGPAFQTYRGYGSRERVFLIGRVLQHPYFGIGANDNTVGRDLVDVLRRFFRRGAPGVTVQAQLADATQRVETDDDGFFRIDMRLPGPLPDDRVWHFVTLSLDADGTADSATSKAAIYVPPLSAKFVVVSDIDDTVVFTGVANKLMMMWRLFVSGAKSRVAFPGVAALYAGLHTGASGRDRNPMLYVSRGPWSIYEVLDTFFNHHRIPNGPVLFLRHWGLTLQSPLPRRTVNHKYDLIRTMLSIYEDRPFILIGDSGQHDPEIYSRLVRENPGRIQAVYIRNVSRSPERTDAIEALAQDLVDEGSSLVLAADSFAIAEHAAKHGLIASGALSRVMAEMKEQDAGAADIGAAARTPRRVPSEQSETDNPTEIQDILEQKPGDDFPPSVAVEPAEPPR